MCEVKEEYACQDLFEYASEVEKENRKKKTKRKHEHADESKLNPPKINITVSKQSIGKYEYCESYRKYLTKSTGDKNELE